MNLANLETFLKIVETGSLVRASEALNVTQSTVTARMKSLEDELGQTLAGAAQVRRIAHCRRA
jgi:DNA-binding transcriptional LysR family regulator